ncbi:DUF222 domain-containing protein [Arthrobacter sp. UYEF36]|uniref:HNH endonuclease signature motif containing protein n=1 Tax=Arthrobacter sp. UYEF36 TaxID=1756366 RepID=UPI00339B4E7D
MERTVWSAEAREALAAVAASVAALAVFASGGDGADRSGADPLRGAESDPLCADPLRADPLRELADGCLDGMTGVARVEAGMAALKVWLTADYAEAARALASPAASLRDHTVQEMALVAEVAGVLTVGEHAAGALLGESQALTTSLPLTLGALQAGTISWAHARIMVDEASNLDPAGAAALEAHFLDPSEPNPARGCPAGDLVPGRFRAKARAWRERHHPVSIEKRHTRCAADRRVEYCPDRDGMAWLSAYLPADTAAGIWERTTAAARALQGPEEPRTLTQLRADIAATLLLTSNTTGATTGTSGGPADSAIAGGGTGTDGGNSADGGGCGGACGGVPVPRAQVLVTVPVLSLLGAGEEPATLDGYGPIPPSMARRLVADGAGSFYRVLTDPRDGAPLEIGRTSYRLTKAMRHWLRLRDGKCPFPGCNNHSLDNDADHLLAWADGGTTGISNLGQPCHKHHRLKHGSGWTPSGASNHSPPGWTSPSGRHYPSEQQDWEPPDWPPGIPATDTLPDPGLDESLPADPGWDPDLDLPAEPGRDPNLELPAEPGWDPDLDLPAEPGRDPNLELPPDLFTDWYLCTAGHPWPP